MAAHQNAHKDALLKPIQSAHAHDLCEKLDALAKLFELAAEQHLDEASAWVPDSQMFKYQTDLAMENKNKAILIRQAISLLRRDESKYVLVPRELVDFLRGIGPLDGCYFGEKPPKERGLYWWRKRLPAYKEAK